MTSLAILAAAAGCLLYLAAAARLRRRGDRWPLRRDVSFCTGGLLLVAVAAGAGAVAGPPFTAHTADHLVTAMAAPVLLAYARPVTLALRALPPSRPRRLLVRTARSRPAALSVFPPVAAVLDIGGLWLLHRTPLLAAAHRTPWLDAVVHVHLFTAGCLFTFGVLALEPFRHRASLLVRGATLLAAAAAHAVLAKSLYAAGPPGLSFAAADLRGASQLMYYGGDVVEIALVVVLAHQWYRAQARSRTVALPSGPAPSAPVGVPPR